VNQFEFNLGEIMSIDLLVGILLVIIALIMSYYILMIKIRRGENISNSEEYSGIARQPEKLSEPSEEAIKELEKLIDKLS
jgi:hypothetical protein|tara:strand:+ start:1855 stop:2094 length:240 start_codon:yes stop_codon:yes gene_type:complete